MPNRWIYRWLFVGICLSCVPGVSACHRDSAAKSQYEKKPISKLTADDLTKFVASLGFDNVAATTSKSAGYANISVIGFKEDPNGELAADGKKRLRLLVSLHDDPEDAASRAAGLDKRGTAYERDGMRTLSVELSNQDREEAKRILDRIVP